MSLKWKNILINWVNCYCNGKENKQHNISLDAIHSILSHLRENLNLDESKSSIIEAHTVEEFIQEKYPHFKFENGLNCLNSEEELCIVASLLLFFVCVNSKDVVMKNAMCNKLSSEDQEVILKFNKCLMECSSITHKDVQAAVNEACGLEVIANEVDNGQSVVSETPPALRSLHGEVRRLQAALDAERFDRNYLQEELSRTNMKVEKLVKDKEQYKLDIMNLKAKISLCCGEQSQGFVGDTAAESSARLMRQLQESDDRLADVQGRLDDAVYERDTYKSKVTELKRERDKWMKLCDREVAQVRQLQEELENERRLVQSLRELAMELRHHQQQNFLDSSQLECDDPDASIHSLPHNLSVCSEACANVVEVQLGEERAKIVQLQEHIEKLQEQINEMTQKYESEKLRLEAIASEKDNHIIFLKRHIQEEDELKKYMIKTHSNEINDLKNNIGELETKLRHTNEQLGIILESKIQEIQNLYVEKMLLIQSLSDETVKSEGIIKQLNSELESEKSFRVKTKAEFDDQVMKLNKQILDNNNELMELKNDLSNKSKENEALQLNVKKEKEEMLQQMELLNNLRCVAENTIKEKCNEFETLINELHNKDEQINDIHSQLNCTKKELLQLQETYNVIQTDKAYLENEIEKRDKYLKELSIDIEGWKNRLTEEKESCKRVVEGFEIRIATLSETVDKTLDELCRQKETYTNIIKDKDDKIEVLEKEKITNEQQYSQEIQEWKNKLNASCDLNRKDKEIYDVEILSLQKIVNKTQEGMEKKGKELQCLINEKQHFESELCSLQNSNISKDETLHNLLLEKDKLEDQLKVFQNTIQEQSNEIKSLIDKLNSNDDYINEMSKEIICTKESLIVLKDKIILLEEDNSLLLNKVNDRDCKIEELINEIRGSEAQITSLSCSNEDLRKELLSKNFEVEKLNENIKSFNEKNQCLVSELVEVKKELKVSTDQLKERIVDNEQLIENINQNEIINKVKLDQLSNLLKEMSTDTEKLREDRKHIENINKEKSEEITQLSETIINNNKCIDSLTADLNFTKESLSKLQVNFNILEDNKVSLLKEIHDRDSTLQQLGGQLDIFKNKSIKEKENYERCKEGYEMKIATLTRNIEETCTEVLNRKELEAKLMEIKDNDIQTLQEDNKSLQLRLNDIQKELDAKVEINNEMLCQVNKLSEKLTETENRLLEKYREIETLHDNLNQANIKINELNDELGSTKDLLTKSKEGYSMQEAFMKNEIKDRDMNLAKLSKELEIKNNDLIEQKDIMEKCRKDLDATNEDLLKKIKDTHSELIEQKCFYQEEIESKTNDINMLQNEIRSIHSKSVFIQKELESKVESLQVELLEKENLIQQLKVNYENQIDNLNVIVSEFSEGIKEKTLEIDNLKKENDKLNEVIEINKANEVSADVVKQQLNEEQTKSIYLEQQIKALQDQINYSSQTKESEKLCLESIISEKDEDIFNLKHRINEEIEAKDKTNEEISKLNNLVNELEQKLTENNNESRIVIETKMREVDALQEEKNTLVHGFSEEKAKLEIMIKNLNLELHNERSTKERIKGEYNDHKMKLNEKVLNRNNELVEMQNNVFDKSEQIEALLMELKKEKLTNENIVQEYHNELKLINERRAEAESREQEKSEEIQSLHVELNNKSDCINELNAELNNTKIALAQLKKNNISLIDEVNSSNNKLKELLTEIDQLKNELISVNEKYKKYINDYEVKMDNLMKASNEKHQESKDRDIQTLQQENETLRNDLSDVQKELYTKVSNFQESLLENETLTEKLKETYESQIENLNIISAKLTDHLKEKTNELDSLKKENGRLVEIVDTNKKVIKKLENEIASEKQINDKVKSDNEVEKERLKHKVNISKSIIEKQKDSLNMKVTELTKANNLLQQKVTELNNEVEEKKSDALKLIEDHNFAIQTLSQQLSDLKNAKDNLEEQIGFNQNKYETELVELKKDINMKTRSIELLENQKIELSQQLQKYKDEASNLDKVKPECNISNNIKSEEIFREARNEEWIKEMAQRQTFAVASLEKNCGQKPASSFDKDYRAFQQQVDSTTSDLTHSSMDSIKTISDLERIILDKNRTITTLQSDITYLKTMIADSENKLLDINKELDMSKENCQQLSSQLKKIVNQKNEEIAELKKQVSKMTVNENRATQIIKISAKYQAIIFKRIAEIKSNTILKELTNFGNSANGDNELRRSLNMGTITMDDLENFLETTDKHIRRCTEKQISLQKERDRLYELNKINESDMINLKKFLTELSVSFKTFSSVKDVYTQKLSRVVSIQRTVRREILNLDGHINDATMCKLERGYAAMMQDLAECVMNLERWLEKCVSRTISTEKIKQAFANDEDRVSLVSTTFQNASLEVQLDELSNSFQKLLEEVVRAQKGEGARDAQAVTVMEVRAEYEDKLNRMKAKMKQLYHEQILAYKENQKKEIAVLERELVKTREKLAESCKGYEKHIRALTTELWRVGEKFLSKKDELDWLQRSKRSGSLMSLQHVHSSGLVAQEEPFRVSDAHSLRSLPVHNNTNTKKREGRDLHMSDEEGEVFDNRWLKELARTPPASPTRRVSELRYRNSLCPPHLKSSYPAETQFAPTVDEEDIKCMGAGSLNRNQRKEVGITAYKKPGPPTPSKQAGRVSATDSELRESLRVAAETQTTRKTSTPSRLRALFRSGRNDTNESTPRRLSIFRRK